MKLQHKISVKAALSVVLTAMLTLWSCRNSDYDDEPGRQLLEQIVTFTGNSSDRVNFEYRANGDSPLISLWAKGNLDEKQAKPGSRLLLRYRLNAGVDPSQGGEIGFVGLRKIMTDTVATLPSPQADGDLYLYSMQRSGEYLDIMARMPMTNRRKITIEADEAIAADGMAELYISATAGSQQLIDSAYEATSWASLWIGPVWQRQDVKGVRVHLNNSNNPYRSTFTFDKQQDK